MNWFAEIFQDNSDKARFMAIMLTSAVAFILFFLNQYYTTKRDYLKLRIEKIEELYKSIINLEKIGLRYMNIIETGEEELKLEEELEKQITEHTSLIYMLGTLHFPESPLYADKNLYSRILSYRSKVSRLSRKDIATAEEYDPIYKEFESDVNKFKEETINLMKKIKKT